MSRNYNVGLVVKGDAKGGVKAVKATKDEVTKLNQKQRKFQQESKRTNNSIGQMSKEFGLLKIGASAAALGLGAAIGSIGQQMYQSVDTFQGYRAQLKTITGDWGSASEELDRLIGVAKETPFTLEQSVEGFTKLTHLGLEPSKEAMISYGNTASAMGKDLMQMVEAVADASVGEFERLKEFGIKTKSVGDQVTFTFQNQATTIKKDAKSIQKYLYDIGNNQFAGAMSDQMGRLSARMSNLGISVDQLFDAVGESGATDVFGDLLDSLAIGIDAITANLPAIIGGLGTLAEIVVAGGALYLGLKSIPLFLKAAGVAGSFLSKQMLAVSLAFSTSTGPVSLFTASLKNSITTTKAAIVQFGLLKSAMSFLFAAYAGWEIGTYLREQFVEARVAGLAFVGAMETGFAYLNYAISSIVQNLVNVWTEVENVVKSGWSSVYSTIGDGLSSIGLDDYASAYQKAAKQMENSIVPIEKLGAELDSLKNARDEEIAKIDKTIVSLIAHEYALNNNSKAQSKHKKETSKKVAETSTELTANQKLIASIGKEIILRQQSAKEQFIATNLSKLSVNAKKEEIDTVRALSAALYEQQQLQDSDGLTEVDKLIEGADSLSQSWSSAGNIIVETFGSIGQQLEKLVVSQDNYAKKFKEVAELKEKYKDNPNELKKLQKYEVDLARTRTSENLSSYASIAGASAKMFDEQSKGREALHRMEQVFTAFEIALSLKKAAANALAAITNQGSGDPYTAFARIAAMAAIMAGLGVFTGSVSGTAVSSASRQESQGAGTLLGSDDKSSSIANALERAEELELDQYAELRQMNASLRDLNNNITNLAVNLVSTYGKFGDSNYSGVLGSQSTTPDWLTSGSKVFSALDPTGVVDKIFSKFSSTKKSLIDSGISIVSQTLGEVIDSGLLEAQAYFDVKTTKKKFWGLSKKTSYNTDYQDIDAGLEHEFALLFESIGNTLNSAIDVLGVDVAKSLESFVIDLPNISFKDLSGEEIQAELEAVFSQQADLMAQHLIPGVREFQQVGEGLYETLIRIAQQQAVFNSVLELTGQSLDGIDANQQIEVSQAIIAFAGSIEELQSAASTYLSEFFTEAEQFEYLQKQLNEQFSALGAVLPRTRDGFKSVISSLDLTREADQRLYAQLMLLVPELDNYYDKIEDGTAIVGTAAEKEAQLNEQRQAFLSTFQEELTRLDMSPLQIKLADLQKEFDEYRNEAAALGADTTLIENLYGRRRQAILDEALTAINDDHKRQMDTLTRTHETAVNNLVANNDRLKNAFVSLNASISSGILSIRRQGADWNESDYQSSQISDFTALLGQGSIEDQISNVSNLTNAYTAKYNAELESINKARDAAQSRYDQQLANIEDKYQLELDIYNSLRDALDSLKGAADALLLSDYSTLTNEQKLKESESQFFSILEKAKLGDLDAVGQLSGAKDSYLKNAQSFYASGSQYSEIFDTVFNAINDVAGQSINAPSKGRAPSVPREIRDHNVAVQQLQEQTVERLLELKTLTAELEAQSESEFEQAMSALNVQLDENTLSITTAIDGQISELQNISAAISEIDVAPVIELPAPEIVTPVVNETIQNIQPDIERSNAAIVNELNSTRTAHERHNEALVRELQHQREETRNVVERLERYQAESSKQTRNLERALEDFAQAAQ